MMIRTMNDVIGAFKRFSNTYRRIFSSTKKWRMMNENGQNTKARKRNQTMLKGRGKRVRSGVYPGRGKGRTAHGRR